jgi:hypothetical protein
MNISDLHRRVLAQKKEQFLLDEFPNAAAAYSLRLLTTAYTGNCIEVRRSSDNALQNIGFVNGVLDTASLLLFVGAGDGFVRTWYDQSGNQNNLIGSVNSNHPQLVVSGSLNLRNNKPFLLFTTNRLLGTAIFNNVGYGSVFSLQKQTAQTGTNRVVFQQWTKSSNGKAFLGHFANTGIRIGGRRLETDSFQTVGLQTWSGNEFVTTSFYKWVEAKLESYINGQSNGILDPFQTAGNTETSTLPLQVGADANNVFNFNGEIKELVFYEIDQTANRTAIESNINDYYNIF